MERSDTQTLTIADVRSIPEPNVGRAAGVCVITDGAAGNERQALALANAMRVAPRIARVALRAPWRWTGPAFIGGARWAVTRRQWREWRTPWPALAIGCGRQSAVMLRTLREASKGACFTVQILDPRISTKHFDLIVAPRHDALHSDNVIQTLGSLNPVDDNWLAQARVQFSTLLHLPRPRTVLLVGGPRHGLDLDERWIAAAIAQLQDWQHRDGGSLLIATSRRTPTLWRDSLRNAFRDGCTCFWGGSEDGSNPYPGYLAVADRIVVTPDSVNMLSEACATGAPVFTSLPNTVPTKLATFHAELRDNGWVHDLHTNWETLLQPPPLREIAVVASKVLHKIEATRPDVAVAMDQNTTA